MYLKDRINNVESRYRKIEYVQKRNNYQASEAREYKGKEGNYSNERTRSSQTQIRGRLNWVRGLMQ